MKRLLVVLMLVVGLLTVGCSSTESNSTSDEIANLSASEGKTEVVDNTVPPNQVLVSAPAEAAPVSEPVAQMPVQKSLKVVAKRRHHKKMARKHKRKHRRHHHVAKKSSAE